MKLSEDELKVYPLEGDGYRRVMSHGAWRVATLAHSERFAEENCVRLERHLITDEVFVLLDGEAALAVGLGAERVPLERGRVYNVPAGSWHAVITRPGARLLIVENDSTSPENSEYRDLEKTK